MLNLMRAILPFLIATACVSPAFAWEIHSFTDRMTDRTVTAAFVTLPEGRLYVGCKNGSIFPEIKFPNRMGFGDIAITTRIDDDRPIPLIAAASRDGRSVWPWLTNSRSAVARLAKAKRLRVQVRDTFLDFDLTGAREAIAKASCGK